VLAGEAFEAGIEFAGILFGKSGNRADAEKVETALDGRADGDEVAELAGVRHSESFRISLYFRHRLLQTLPHRRVGFKQILARIEGEESW
jgi:hypothetical protein